jgi:hypothetical protein
VAKSEERGAPKEKEKETKDNQKKRPTFLASAVDMLPHVGTRTRSRHLGLLLRASSL